ncbi:hypothetical protein [Neptuniibacter halophilus]|uniref:hypothetical protein n=1 Tax=Neptuniibacter halophilus TaxID=651666 RepID=UPI0025748F91|nr:hypothetical protein [Neptuniibacter halophilus]
MLDVRVCPSCLTRRANGFSRVSEKIWQACLAYLPVNYPDALIEQDDFIEVYLSAQCRQLLMSSEEGFNVEDGLLQEVIRQGFVSYRMSDPKQRDAPTGQCRGRLE